MKIRYGSRQLHSVPCDPLQLVTLKRPLISHKWEIDPSDMR